MTPAIRADYSVASTAELASIHTDALQEGSFAWVASTSSYWVLQKNSGAAVGPNVIQPPVAGANTRWINYSSLLPASGIDQLTGDVTAGPGTGSVAATVVGLQGNDVSAAAPTNGQVMTWNAGTSLWEPQTPSGGTVTSINVTGTNAFGTINAGTPVCWWSTSDGAVIPASCAWSGSYATANYYPIGIATNTTAAGGTVQICTFGEASFPTVAGGRSLPLFVSYGGGVAVQFGAIGAAGPYRVIKVGTLKTDSTIFVAINDLGTIP